jgi:hypothetical protein
MRIKRPLNSFRPSAFRRRSATPMRAFSVYRVKIVARAAVAITLVVFSLAAISRHGAWLSLKKNPALHAAAQLAPGPQFSAENNISGTFSAFEVSAAGTGALQGTVAFGLDPTGEITGPYLDKNRVAHGYLRSANGTITKFDVPGAGNKPPASLGEGGGVGLLAKNQGTIPVGVNGGVVVGTYTDDNLAYHGFVRAGNGTITKFDVPGVISGTGTQTYEEGTKPIGINASGTIVGDYVDSNDYLYHGFLRSPTGTITKFDVPGSTSDGEGAGGTMPIAINASGDVTGTYIGQDSGYHGFLRKANGTFVSFDPPDAKVEGGYANTDQYAGTIAFAINDAGVIAGTYVDGNLVRHGFVRAANGTFSEFDAPGAGSMMTPYSSPYGLLEGTGAVAIDPAGDVAGMYLDTNLAYHAFIRYTNGEISTFDAPGANTTALHGTGLVSGTYVDANFVAHGFVLTPASAPTPSLSPASSSFLKSISVSIKDVNAAAQIHYTLDGTTPTAASALYKSPISIAKTTTVKAIAVVTGDAASPVASATYTLLKPQTITFAQPTTPVVYGVKPITLTATSSSGLAVTFAITSGPAKISGSTLTVTGAGTIVVTAKQTGNSVYAPATPLSRSIVVSPAKLKVTATNLTMKQGAAVPTLTYTVSGFVNSDTQAKATTGAPTLTTTATSKSVPGTYPITIAVGTLKAANYSFSFVKGTLTVTK